MPEERGTSDPGDNFVMVDPHETAEVAPAPKVQKRMQAVATPPARQRPQAVGPRSKPTRQDRNPPVNEAPRRVETRQGVRPTLHGILDTRETMQEMVQRDLLCGHLAFRFSGLGERSTDMESAQARLSLCRIITTGRQLSLAPHASITGASRRKIIVATVAEAFMPNLPEEYFMDRRESREALKSAAIRLHEWDDFGSMFNQTSNQILADLQGVDPSAVTVPSQESYESEIDDYLKALVPCLVDSSVPKLMNNFVMVLIAIIKRGTMTSRFIQKVVDGVSVDLGLNLSIDEEITSTLFKYYGRYVDDIAMRYLVDDWSSWLPLSALRLRITIEQAAGAGLTALKVISKGFMEHENFPWEMLCFLPVYGAQMANLSAAILTIGDNVYYGYRTNMGPAASTKYSNITWVAKELLLKYGGNDTLTRYGGFMGSVPDEASIRSYITAYLDDHKRVTEGEEPTDLVMTFGRNRPQDSLERAIDMVARIKELFTEFSDVYTT